MLLKMKLNELHAFITNIIQTRDCMSVTSLSASLLQKVNAAIDRLFLIALNWKLLRKFRNWCKSSRHIKAKSCKKKSCKTRSPSTDL